MYIFTLSFQTDRTTAMLLLSPTSSTALPWSSSWMSPIPHVADPVHHGHVEEQRQADGASLHRSLQRHLFHQGGQCWPRITGRKGDGMEMDLKAKYRGLPNSSLDDLIILVIFQTRYFQGQHKGSPWLSLQRNSVRKFALLQKDYFCWIIFHFDVFTNWRIPTQGFVGR